VVVCVKMELMLENLKLNKKEEETWRQKEKTRRERLNRDKKLGPITSETLDIKGELVMGGNVDEHRGLQLEQYIHTDCKGYTGEFPILVKEQQTCHIPWGAQDLEQLISRLPNIHNGASKWIRMFEEGTVENDWWWET